MATWSDKRAWCTYVCMHEHKTSSLDLMIYVCIHTHTYSFVKRPNRYTSRTQTHSHSLICMSMWNALKQTWPQAEHALTHKQQKLWPALYSKAEVSCSSKRRSPYHWTYGQSSGAKGLRTPEKRVSVIYVHHDFICKHAISTITNMARASSFSCSKFLLVQFSSLGRNKKTCWMQTRILSAHVLIMHVCTDANEDILQHSNIEFQPSLWCQVCTCTHFEHVYTCIRMYIKSYEHEIHKRVFTHQGGRMHKLHTLRGPTRWLRVQHWMLW